MLGNFGVFSFLRYWKLTCFNCHHLSKCNSILNFVFQRFSVLSLKRLDRILLSSVLTLLDINLSYSELFFKTIWNVRSELYLRFIWIQTYRIFYFLRMLFAKHLIAGLDRAKFWFYLFQSFLFIVVIMISISLKTTFWQISIHSQNHRWKVCSDRTRTKSL